MSETDPLLKAMIEERDALVAAAPPPDLPGLWRTVRARREAQFEARLAWVASAPAALLLIAGAVALLAGAGWHLSLPCWAVAFWLAGQGAGAGAPLSLRGALPA